MKKKLSLWTECVQRALSNWATWDDRRLHNERMTPLLVVHTLSLDCCIVEITGLGIRLSWRWLFK